jgi:hypothetical protein
MLRITKITQDSVDDILVLDTRNDPDRSTTAAAYFNPDLECALEPLGPGHCSVSAGG